jgi:LysR family transcriptional regulator, hydrogen peroxide-inducible genes activator
MEMHQVRYFLAVCEELNFTRAAERCNVAQPSLTRAIKLLEDEFGGPLFHRERSNTHLSELGRLVRPHLEQAYRQALEAKRHALDFGKLKRAILKLGLMCTIAPAKALDIVRGLRTRHPGIELQLIDAPGSVLVGDLLEGRLEVSICCQPDSQYDPRLHHIPLYRERFVIVVGPDHHLAAQEAVRVQDLNGEHYLERVHCEFGEYAGRIFEQQGVSDRTVYRSDRDDWILAMAAAGMGYAFMPEECARHPAIAVRPLIEPEIWREVSLVSVRGRPHSAGVGALVREVTRVRRDAVRQAAPSPAKAGKQAEPALAS